MEVLTFVCLLIQSNVIVFSFSFQGPNPTMFIIITLLKIGLVWTALSEIFIPRSSVRWRHHCCRRRSLNLTLKTMNVYQAGIFIVQHMQ